DDVGERRSDQHDRRIEESQNQIVFAGRARAIFARQHRRDEERGARIDQDTREKYPGKTPLAADDAPPHSAASERWVLEPISQQWRQKPASPKNTTAQLAESEPNPTVAREIPPHRRQRPSHVLRDACCS